LATRRSNRLLIPWCPSAPATTPAPRASSISICRRRLSTKLGERRGLIRAHLAITGGP
jgi:hypothetical protein